MAFFGKTQPDSIASLEAEVAELRKTLASLEARDERAVRDLAEAETARDNALRTDSDDEIERTAARVATIESLRRGLERALSEQRQKVDETETALAAARDKAERFRKADALEELAKEIRGSATAFFASVDELAGLLGKAGGYEAGPLGGAIAMLARGVEENSLPSLLREFRYRAQQLRADPPPRPAPKPPPPSNDAPSGIFHSVYEGP